MKIPSSTRPIFINGRFLTQQLTGVQAFAQSVCREMLQSYPVKILVPANEEVVNDEFNAHLIRFGRLKGHLWEQLELSRYLKNTNGSVLLNLCNTGPLHLKNQVVTIHDLAFIKNPKWFNPIFRTFYKFLIPRICHNSRAVLTVSETIKNELISDLGIKSDKIFVVGNKVSENLLLVQPSKPPILGLLPNEYFLMVGSQDPRKNFAFAERLFTQGFHGKKLVIVGGSHRNFNKVGTVSEASDFIKKAGMVSNAELRWLYENAIALINPSLYEGFGIPNLEAMAIGCPILCSNISVFREICDDAADYFDPVNEASLKSALEKVLDNNVLTAGQVLKGKVIFEGFQNTNRTSVIIKALTS